MADDQKDKERLKKALDSMIFLPHLKDRAAPSVLLPPATAGPGAVGRPWDQGDLFRRLRTFKPSTWFAKPDAISARECARRGWTNVGADTLSCECCGAMVSCPIPPQLLPDEAAKTAERYAAQLADGHERACPWRGAVCSLSLLAFPQLPRSAVGLDFAERGAALGRVLALPPLAPAALTSLTGGALGPAVARLIEAGPDSVTATQNAAQPTPQRTAASPALTAGAATCDSEAFQKRLRTLTLCGWTLEALAGEGGEPSSRVGPESAMLSCTLCGARAGLWTYFPDCQPQASPPPKAASTQAKASEPRQVPRASRRQSSGAGAIGSPGAGALHRHVAVNLETTIAGGSMEEAAQTGGVGPFGAAAAPAFGSPAPAAAAAAPAAPAEGTLPVFGFAALRAAEPGSVSALLQKSAAKRRADEAFLQAALGSSGGVSGGGDGDKRPRSDAGQQKQGQEAEKVAASNSKAVAAAAPPPPPAATLQRLRAAEASPLDPLALHRRHCPWVHAATATEGTDRAALCGWQWCAQQLSPEGVAEGAAAAGAGGDEEESEGGGDGAAWNPAALLRNALSKVEVKKS